MKFFFFFNYFGELFSTVFKIFYYDYRLIIFSMFFFVLLFSAWLESLIAIMSVPATVIPYSNRMKSAVIIRAVCKPDTLFWFLIIFSITRASFFFLSSLQCAGCCFLLQGGRRISRRKQLLKVLPVPKSTLSIKSPKTLGNAGRVIAYTKR